LNKGVSWNKEGKKYKEDYDSLFNMCESLKPTSSDNELEKMQLVIGDVLSVDVDSVTLNLEVTKGIPKTFKFLGMDVTEDLDVVVVGSFGAVFVAQLFNTEVVEYLLQLVMPDHDFKKVLSGVSADGLRLSIENLKFKDLANLPTNTDSTPIQLTEDSLDWFTFLDNIIEDVKSVKESGFSSVVLNFISGALDSSDIAMDNTTLRKSIYYGICSLWKEILERYTHISRVVSIFDLFFRIRKGAYGLDSTIKGVKGSLSGESQFGDIGCFEGFCKDDAMDGRTFSCNIAKSFMASVGQLFLGGSTVLTVPTQLCMTTMFEYPNSMDITKYNRQSCLGASVVDGLKYIDSDLEYVTSSYDLTNDSERELLYRNVISGYQKKFRTFLGESGLDVEDEVIRLAMPSHVGDIDILNVLNSKKVDTNVDVEVSKVAFNLDSFIKASRLVAKICDLLVKEFKAP
jgi:hypothetical protein